MRGSRYRKSPARGPLMIIFVLAAVAVVVIALTYWYFLRKSGD
ncbi:hypothetical protein [Actinocorallia populi]|nr:hypothetical protein [Actinocorallia populi]